MAGAAAARYYTNREWSEYESDAARRSAERVAARERRRLAEPDPRSRASAGRKIDAGRSAVAAAAPSVRPAGRPIRQPALRLVARPRRRTRRVMVPLLVFGFLLLVCGGAAPVLLNMAAFHFKAEAVMLERQVSSLRAEQAEYNTQAAALGSAARLQDKAGLLGLELATGVAYIEVPGVKAESALEDVGSPRMVATAGAVAVADVGAAAGTRREGRESPATATSPSEAADEAAGRGARTP